ncbi:hypothetical protein BZA77DRAFT_157423 [Pyronema omphalodes]|nr:hypothetical protein BZA77DRAFT_157423 [Pyronema omphalodes]
MKWPLKKDELEEAVVGLQRVANIFQYWMTVKNYELMSGTFSIVLSQLDDNRQEVEKAITVMQSLSITVPPNMQQQIADIPKMKTLLSELERFNIKEVRNISRGINEVQERLQDDEIQKMMPWISTLQPHKRHQDIQQKRLKGTGEWFLLQPEFEKWRDSEVVGDGDTSCVLVCSGMPGAGKSVMCSLVYDHLDTKFRFSLEGKACVVCLYCDYEEEENQTSVNMIDVLLKQVIATLNESGSLPSDTISALRQHLNRQKHLDLPEACRLLAETVKQLQKLYVCIDALDECNVHNRRQLVQSLETISSECSPNTSIRIFFTTRPHIGFMDILKLNPRLGPVEDLELKAQPDDIRKYVSHIIDMDDNGDCMTDELRREIVDRIVENSDGMFLLPALQIRTVLDQTTIRKRRAALVNMPTKLETAFASTINRIKNQKSERLYQALEVLKWILLAQRPLTAVELRHALSVTIDLSKMQSGNLPLAYNQTLDWDNFPSERSLIDWCLGLVIIDEETSTLRFVHKSLHEYLTSLYEEGEIFPDGHSEIAYTCLQYMLFEDDQFEMNATTPRVTKGIIDRRRARFCLLDYATNNFGRHLCDKIPLTSNMIRGLFSNTVNLRCISTGLRSMFLYPFHELWEREDSCAEHEYIPSSQIHLRLQFSISCGLEQVFLNILDELRQSVDLNTKLGSSTMLWQASYEGQESINCIVLCIRRRPRVGCQGFPSVRRHRYQCQGPLRPNRTVFGIPIRS